MPTFTVPKTVKLEVVKKILAEGKPRSFDDFVALAFGPKALALKPIKITPAQLQISRTLFNGEADGSHTFVTAMPAIRLFMREYPRARKQFISFCDAMIVQMNGNGDSNVQAALGAPMVPLRVAHTKAAEAKRRKAIERLRGILKTGRKQCSKCGKTKAIDKFSRQRNPYYPEVGEEMMPGSWCLECAGKKRG